MPVPCAGRAGRGVGRDVRWRRGDDRCECRRGRRCAGRGAGDDRPPGGGDRSLRRRLADERTAEEVRAALAVAAGTGRLAAPVEHGRLLEMIVETAAQVIGARCRRPVPDRRRDPGAGLRGRAGAEGEPRSRSSGCRSGTASPGSSPSTGQPMAVSDAAQRPAPGGRYRRERRLRARRASSASRCSTGTGSSACSSCSTRRARRLSARRHRRPRALRQPGGRRHRAVAGPGQHRRAARVLCSHPARPAALLRAIGLATSPRASRPKTPPIAEALELAALVQEIAWRGERELQACRAILDGFAEYLRDAARSDGLVGGIG